MSAGTRTTPSSLVPIMDRLKIVSILLTVILFVVVVVFSGLAGAGEGVFDNELGDVSDKFSLDITPDDKTFGIWIFIYAWLGAGLLYAVAAIFRRADPDTRLYELPVLPVALFTTLSANLAIVLGWLFAWDNDQLAVAFVLIFFALVAIMACLYVSLTGFADNLHMLQEKCLKHDEWLIRGLVHNGLAFYAFWLLGATFLGLALVLRYKDGDDVTDTAMDQGDAGTLVLALYGAVVVAWVKVDLLLLDKYTRYLVAPHIAVTAFLGGIVAENFDLDDSRRNSILSLVLLIVAGLALLTKLVVMGVRHKKAATQVVSCA